MKRLATMWTGAFVLGTVLVLGLTDVAGAQNAPPNDPAAVLSAFERAAFANPHDLDAALGMFAADGVLRIVPPPPGTTGVWTGREQIRQGLQYGSEHKVQRANVGSPQVDGNTLSTTAMVTNDFFAAWGVAPVEHSTELVVEGGKIKAYISTMVPAERERVAAAARAFQARQAAAPPVALPSTGVTPILPLAAATALVVLIAGVALRKRKA